MRFCSFGRSFLWPHGIDCCSGRRWRVALAAARARWPDGRLVVDRPGRAARYMVPRGIVPAGSEVCGLLLTW